VDWNTVDWGYGWGHRLSVELRVESRSTLTGMDLNDLTFDWATDEVLGHECDHQTHYLPAGSVVSWR
jgi:hypothetical protein